MKHLLAAVFCCVIISVGTIDAAQVSPAPPNLSGIWTHYKLSYEGRGNRNDNQPGGGGLRIGAAPASLVIAQDRTTITVVERYSAWPDNKVEYRLDNQMVRNRFRLTPDLVASEVTSRWQDNKLVSTVLIFLPGQSEPRRYQQTMSLDPNGVLMVRMEDDSSNSRTLTFRRK